jgi:multimeric flavodoxin WrbA
MKKIVMVTGSPRENGNSQILAGEAARGARDGGAAVALFNLDKMTIAPCRACLACRSPRTTGCAINDDMQILYPQLTGCDALIIVSPIYWKSVSAQTKLFIDRFYALHRAEGQDALAGKQIGIILVYANSDPFVSGCINAIRMFQDIFEYVGAPVAGLVYGRAYGAGEVKANAELMQKAYELGCKLGA